MFRLVVRRIRQKFARCHFRLSGHLSSGALSTSVMGLERLLVATRADIFFAHNIDTLLTAHRAARRLGASVLFDSMEFHSEMGDSQSDIERSVTRAVESHYLPECALVFAASDQIAEELVKVYGIRRPITLRNVPPVEAKLPFAKTDGFQLYWRNSVVGLGQRGLDEALLALRQLPDNITLHLQGPPARDGGRELEQRIKDLGLTTRVTFHPPYAPEDAVKEAARHTIGLCLERSGPKNHELTVSNKIFDYHMAGLVTIASELPGLRSVLEKSRGGLTFQPGSADDLAKVISRLYRDKSLISRLSANARAFALSEGNSESEMSKLRSAFLEIYGGAKCESDGSMETNGPRRK